MSTFPGKNEMKQGVCLLIPAYQNNMGDILAVSRRNDTTQWAIPGGKIDPNESPEHAVLREVEEECGLHLYPEFLIPVYAGPCYGKDGQDFWTTCYFYNCLYSGTPRPETGLSLKIMPLIELTRPDVSPFANYNANVIAAARNLKSFMFPELDG
jgi:ADP-ribose pyrophosphatase YjhB (NUDIX family)